MNLAVDELARRLSQAPPGDEARALGWIVRHAQAVGWVAPETAARGLACIEAGAFIDAALLLVPADAKEWRLGNALDVRGYGGPWAAVGPWQLARGSTAGLATAAATLNARGMVAWAPPPARFPRDGRRG